MRNAMAADDELLSPWWRRSVLLILVLGFAVLSWLSVASYRVGPPIPERVVGPSGEVLFTGDEILRGQEVFLRRGLMEERPGSGLGTRAGSIWIWGASGRCFWPWALSGLAASENFVTTPQRPVEAGARFALSLALDLAQGIVSASGIEPGVPRSHPTISR